MKPQNRSKVIPYLILNFTVAVFFQNCKSNTDSSSGVGNPASAEVNNSTHATANHQHDSEGDARNPMSDNSVVGILPGEIDVVELVDPQQPENSLLHLKLKLVSFDSTVSEAYFNIIKDAEILDLVGLTCIHADSSKTETFDCINLNEFILENLEKGRHQIKVVGDFSDGSSRHSRTLQFTVR